MSKKIDELDKLVPASKDIFEDFLKTYSASSHAAIRTAIRTVIIETGIHDFSLLTYTDYIKFEPTTPKNKLITTFFKYIYCHDIIKNENGFEQCYWNKEQDIALFKKRTEPTKAEKTTEKGEPYVPSLTMEQLERLLLFEHECTHSDEINFKNQRLAFCFYLLYFEDLQISTIRNNLNARNFNNGKLVTDEKVLDIPEKYWDMLNYYKERHLSGFTQLDEYTRRLGNMVGIKDLVPNNITKKRTQNMFTCPECGKTNLSFSANWKSVNGILICNDCTERITLSGQKKNVTELSSVDIDLFEEDVKDKIHISNSSFKKMKKNTKFPTNYIELHKFMIKIGELGEKYVYESEYNRLLKKDNELADMVDSTPASNPENGFDILSYTETGEKIYIEVKTTTNSENSPFYMSKHELSVAKKLWASGANYQIHRIYDIMNEDDSKIGYVIYDSLEKLNLTESSYKVEPK